MSDLSLWLVLLGSVTLSVATTLKVGTSAIYRAEVERWARSQASALRAYGLLSIALSVVIPAAWVWHAVATGNWLYAAIGCLSWAWSLGQSAVKIAWVRKARREKPPLVTMQHEPRPGETETQTVVRVQSALRIHDTLTGAPKTSAHEASA